MRTFCNTKSQGIRQIPWYGIPRNSEEFRAIPYTIRNIRNLKKHAEFWKHPMTETHKGMELRDLSTVYWRISYWTLFYYAWGHSITGDNFGDILLLVTFCEVTFCYWWRFVRWHFMRCRCVRWHFVRWCFVGVPK